MSCRCKTLVVLARRGFFLVAVSVASPIQGAEYPSAPALLRGVEAARKVAAPLKASFTMEFIAPAPSFKIECVVECDGQKCRFESGPTKTEPQTITIVDSDEVRRFRRKPHEDVCIYDMPDALGSRAIRAFDPRILGLSDVMAANATVRRCLGYESTGEMEVVGAEVIDGTNVWRVRIKKMPIEHNFWIEEPSFRLHRRTIEWDKSKVDIRSEFDLNDPDSPLPKRVHIERAESGRTREIEITMTSLEWPAAIPPERFTLKSMDLPKNTMINDYRINRIVGYWDGEGISKDPIHEAISPAAAPPSGAGQRWPLVAASTLLLVLIVILVLRRYNKAKARNA